MKIAKLSNMDSHSLGSDNRPPLLKRGEYSAWRSRFLNFLESKDNATELLDSIENGPAIYYTDVEREGNKNSIVPAERVPKNVREYTEDEKVRSKANRLEKPISCKQFQMTYTCRLIA